MSGSVGLPDRFKTLTFPTPTYAVNIPVSTAGIALVVNEVHKQCVDISRYKLFEELSCTIYQLYRVTLAQFENQLLHGESLAPGKLFPFRDKFDFQSVVERRGFNFYPLVLIINGIGCTQMGKRRFTSFMPGHYVSQAFINFSNLKEAVTWLANNPSDWGRNLLPGARVRNGLLQNPEDFWPVGYDAGDLNRDCLAVTDLCRRIEYQRHGYFCPVGISMAKCTFSGKGDPMILVSATDPVVYLPPIESDAPLNKIKSSRTIWHSPVPSLYPETFAYGAYSMVGWTSEELEKTEPWLRVRSNYNSAQEKVRRWNDFWNCICYMPPVPESGVPDCFTSLSSPNPIAIALPVSTAGVGLVVNEVYELCRNIFRFSKQCKDLSDQCTIYQLYRVSLAQFEYQLWRASRQRCVPSYHVNSCVPFNKKCKFIRDEMNVNFYPLVLIINGIGCTQMGKRHFTCFMPDCYVSQAFINFSNLEDAVTWLANNPSDWGRNLLPGARVSNGHLRNPEDFWPVGYDVNDLSRDYNAVQELCFQVEYRRTSHRRLSSARCSFSGEGDSMILVSATDPEICLPLIDQKGEASSSTTNCDSEITWHSPVPLNPKKFSYGAYSMVGWTSKELEETEPWLRVRSNYNSALEGYGSPSRFWYAILRHESTVWYQAHPDYSDDSSD